MEKRPISTDDEVVELLRKHAIKTEEEGETFEQLANSNKLAYPALTNPSIQLSLLEKWAGISRSRLICVHLRESEFGCGNYYFFVGKCGWLFERLKEQQVLFKNSKNPCGRIGKKRYFIFKQRMHTSPSTEAKLTTSCITKTASLVLTFNPIGKN